MPVGLTSGLRREILALPLTAEDFARATGVSRETLTALERYIELLARWQRRINLVSSDSLAGSWSRHMLDSAQLEPLMPPGTRVLVDLGSGAGFPGLVAAVLGIAEVHLIESDERKCAFLAEAARVTGLKQGRDVYIHCARIEKVRGPAADVVTARACAPLARLLDYAEPFLGSRSICLFHKGARVGDELTAAAKNWRMTVERHQSVADPSGTILRLGQVQRAGR